MKKTFFITLFICVNIYPTTRSVLSGTIDSTGWRLIFEVENTDTGGTFNFRMGNYNYTDSATCILTIYSYGFNSSGELTTKTRFAYAKDSMRLPYPNQATTDWDMNGSNALIKVILSHCVFDSDSVVINIDQGLYIDGTDTSAQATNLVATNSSQAIYSDISITGNWARVDRLFTSDSVRLACNAYHDFGVGSVRFKIWDQHGDTLSSLVGSSTTANSTDTFPAGEWRHNFSTSTFNDSDSVVCRFEALPAIGDSTAILYSNNDTLRCFSLHDQIYHIDKSGWYGKSYAVVDSASGSDAGCAAYDDSASAAADPCSTCAKALSVCVAYNFANYGRNNADNSEILLKKGTYECMGGASAVVDTGIRRGWATFKPYPGVSRDSILLIEDDGDVTYSMVRYRYTKWSNVTFDLRGAGNDYAIAGLSNTTHYIWADSCIILGDSASTASVTSTWAYNFLHVIMTNCIAYGHYYMTGDWCKNNRFYGVSGGRYPIIYFVSNYFSHRPGVTHGLFGDVVDTLLTLDNIIVANNQIYNTVAQMFNYTIGPKYGMAVINNVIESVNLAAAPIMVILSDDHHPCYYIKIHGNTFVGQRCNLAYTQQSDVEYKFFSIKGNIFYYWANKTDIVHEDPEGVRGWPIAFGINAEDNITYDFASIPEDGGLRYKVLDSFSKYGFLDDNSLTGDSTGFGNYRLSDSSYAYNYNGGVFEPFDVMGVRRRGFGIGAFESNNRRCVISIIKE